MKVKTLKICPVLQARCVPGRFIVRALTLAVLAAGFQIAAIAQTSIFAVPTTDTQDKRSAYLSPEGFVHFDKYEKGGFYTVGPLFVYGLTKNIEIGVNYFYTRDARGHSHELQPNIKWRFYNNRRRGFAAALGALVFVPLNKTAGNRTSTMLYANASKTFLSARGLRLTGGAYHMVNTENDFGTRTGALVGLEQPLTENVSLLADWTSGNNRQGYSNIGFNFQLTPRQDVTIGYTFGNSGRANNYLSVFYGIEF